MYKFQVVGICPLRQTTLLDCFLDLKAHPLVYCVFNSGIHNIHGLIEITGVEDLLESLLLFWRHFIIGLEEPLLQYLCDGSELLLRLDECVE